MTTYTAVPSRFGKTGHIFPFRPCSPRYTDKNILNFLIKRFANSSLSLYAVHVTTHSNAFSRQGKRRTHLIGWSGIQKGERK